jgi:glycosyltransferase involved in cell wall biosynthesis
MLSAIIITHNEEKNIERCIDSLLGVANEIIVVDSYSTDATENICRNKNVRFIQHAFEGYIQQKNFAMQQATHQFVLALDADECLSDELKDNILSEKYNFSFDAYSMNRKNNFCGQWINHSGWYPDRKIRLWNKEKGEWGGNNPHDKVVMKKDCTTSFLKGDILHFTVATIPEFKNQQQRFATIAAEELFKSDKKRNALINFLMAVFMFKRRYFFQLGFLDGYYGFVICKEAALYTYRKYAMAKKMRVQNKSLNKNFRRQ